MTRSALPALAVGLLAAAACDNKDAAERCDELAAYLEGREASLDTSCVVDADCYVVFVRPDRPVAASERVADPALDRVIATYRAECGPIPTATGAADAICERRLLEIASPDDPTVAEFIELEPVCALQGEWSVPDVGTPDAGSDVPMEDVVACACERDSQCAGDAFCADCVCVPDTECGRACADAAQCGALQTLGLGADAAVCAAGCQGSLDADPAAYDRFVDCLADSTCDRIDRCGTRVP